VGGTLGDRLRDRLRDDTCIIITCDSCDSEPNLARLAPGGARVTTESRRHFRGFAISETARVASGRAPIRRRRLCRRVARCCLEQPDASGATRGGVGVVREESRDSTTPARRSCWRAGASDCRAGAHHAMTNLGRRASLSARLDILRPTFG
jgi:hypothetical protein